MNFTPGVVIQAQSGVRTAFTAQRSKNATGKSPDVPCYSYCYRKYLRLRLIYFRVLAADGHLLNAECKLRENSRKSFWERKKKSGLKESQLLSSESISRAPAHRSTDCQYSTDKRSRYPNHSGMLIAFHNSKLWKALVPVISQMSQ